MIFDNAADMIAWVKGSLEKVVIMSLDHDLEPSSLRDGRAFDPGTGRDVVDFLVTQKPAFPVIIHTSNHIAGDGMKYALEDARWINKRVLPFDDFETEWIETVANLMAKRI